jgi:hypothetical protein
MALDTVAMFITEARALLLDEAVPYRYSDASLISALNMGIEESYRLRPDMWLSFFELPLPQYLATSPTDAVVIPKGFKSAFLFYMVGLMQLRDDEGASDSRAGSMLQAFASKLLVVPS